MEETDKDWSQEDKIVNSLEDHSNRIGFIRKVYLLLFSQLLITTIFVLIGALSEGFRDFVYDYWWIMIISFCLSLIPLLLIFFVRSYARTVPINYCLLFLFTVLTSFTTACITAFYEPKVILIAFGCTAFLTGALTLYAWFIKTDASLIYGLLIVISFSLLTLLVLMLVADDDDVYMLVFCPLAIIFYGLYLVLDTMYIVSKKKYGMDYDDYVLGVIILYIDILGLFYYLMSCIGRLT